ncbi:poly(hydroxyalkanoate) depolymerase family esterase [Neobacillus niacini]|uniref:extracellular catalytic domain type 1 short-chain-length polyhydroxyalkanoate depolymerase n=1 Tax=Neobacillus niacini TaxID=86668 RepID=UPI00285BE906|nr:PHB depolymerase family esterase [Neobacillus niacini]MDR7079779.1 poly(hydroxyalkanoate) depolymerase family esterase [Neobacillus niacini]
MGEFLDFIYHDFKYKLYVPGEYNSDKESPLLVMLHGCGQNPDDFAAGTNMNTLAEKEKFLVLYPDMNHLLNPLDPAGYNPFGCWNWFLDKNQHRGKGHPKLIYGIINEVKSKYKIDSNKVYAAGLSAGGSLACILGVTYPDVFNGIGICSGLAYDAANVFFLTDPMAEEAKKSMEKGVHDPYACGNSAFQEMGEYKKKIRVVVFHGICDTTVHPINGQQVITQWAQTNFLVEGGIGLADVTPALVKSDIINGNSYTQHVYNDGDGEPLLELWMIDKMGHTWSGGRPNGSYTDPSGPNATEIIWDFFSKHQQQPEEKLIEIPAKKPSSALVELPVNPPVQTPTETAAELPIESSVKTSIELTVKPQDESPSKSPKKNFFSILLSKLIKRKK